jgi:folylpolyglutamate synthase/dihydropteroate synthase
MPPTGGGTILSALLTCIVCATRSSPHLIEPRERIRINGQPLSEALFAHYTREVYLRALGVLGKP